MGSHVVWFVPSKITKSRNKFNWIFVPQPRAFQLMKHTKFSPECWRGARQEKHIVSIASGCSLQAKNSMHARASDPASAPASEASAVERRRRQRGSQLATWTWRTGSCSTASWKGCSSSTTSTTRSPMRANTTCCRRKTHSQVIFNLYFRRAHFCNYSWPLLPTHVILFPAIVLSSIPY